MKKNKSNFYKDFAGYYDIYAHEFDYDLWFRYLKKISDILDFRGKQVLDLGCGTGILLSKFAKEKAAVTGVDLSDKMLSITDQKLFKSKQKALLIKSDIAAFVSGNHYDFIYSTCDTINYLNADAFERLMDHIFLMLKNDGKFTFDILNKNYFEYTFSEDEFLIRGIKYIFERNLHTDKLFTHVTIIDGNTVLQENHIQYFISSEMIEKAAQKHGFTVCGIWDIFSKNPSNDQSEKLQVLVQKAKNI